jgi:hypothetical protein
LPREPRLDRGSGFANRRQGRNLGRQKNREAARD